MNAKTDIPISFELFLFFGIVFLCQKMQARNLILTNLIPALACVLSSNVCFTFQVRFYLPFETVFPVSMCLSSMGLWMDLDQVASYFSTLGSASEYLTSRKLLKVAQ